MIENGTSSNSSELLPANTYFIRKAICTLTTKIPPSKELNQINIYLKRAILEGHLYDQIESYMARLVYAIPMPTREKPYTL